MENNFRPCLLLYSIF